MMACTAPVTVQRTAIPSYEHKHDEPWIMIAVAMYLPS